MSATGLSRFSKGSQSINRPVKKSENKVGSNNTTCLVLADVDSGSGPILINFTVFTQYQFVRKKLVILPTPVLAIGGNVGITSYKIRLIILSEKVLKNDRDDVSTHDLATKWDC